MKRAAPKSRFSADRGGVIRRERLNFATDIGLQREALRQKLALRQLQGRGLADASVRAIAHRNSDAGRAAENPLIFAVEDQNRRAFYRL